MLYKTLPLVLLSFVSIGIIKTTAQNATSVKPKEETFFSVTRNKAWTVSQYFMVSSHTDRRSSFKNCTFRFNQDIVSSFLIESAGTKNMMGHWKSYENSEMVFSLPLISPDTSNFNGSDSATTANPRRSDTTISLPNAPLRPTITLFSNTQSDSSYNEVARLLSGGVIQITDLKPAKIKLRLIDALRGEVFIEFLRTN